MRSHKIIVYLKGRSLNILEVRAIPQNHPHTIIVSWKVRSPRPYEGMNITSITGLTAAQKATLKTLGAVDYAKDN
jgi:hypothetical protein